MLKKLAQIALITISLSAVSLNASAETMMDSVHSLQTQWAEIKYQTFDEDDQVKKLTALADEAKTLSESHPNDAEPKIWYGIILSTRAGVKGGLGALKDVKHAKKLFEDALKLNPNALDGSAYTSLGALYYQVPGWPIGFGDDDKAEELLKKSVTMNPDSIDSLYFYGEYLVDQKRYAEAEQVLQHALKAAPRPNRKVADAGRRQEIQASLSTIKGKNRSFIRSIVRYANYVKYDSQGRIQIPEILLNYSKIEKNVCIIGVIKKIEIWDPKILTEYESKKNILSDNDFDELANEINF